MIYLPFAGSVLPPVWALTTAVVFDLFGPLPNVPRAIKEGEPKVILRLGFGAALTIPLGLYLLSIIEPDLFRWTVAVVSLTLLTLLIAG